MKPGDRLELLARRARRCVDLGDRLEHHIPALEEQRVEDLLLGGEVVVHEAVGDTGLVGDVRHAAGVKALAGEHPDRGLEDDPALVDRRLGGRQGWTSTRPSYTSGRRWVSDGSLRLTSRKHREVQVGDDRRLGVRSGREHEPPRVDDHRSPAGAVAARVRPDLIGPDHEALGLDRAGAQQQLPVVPRGRQRERGGHDDHLRPAHGERLVELGEADVVTDAHPKPGAVGQLASRPPRRPAARARIRRTRCRRPRRRTCAACGTRRAARRRARRARSCSRSSRRSGMRSAIDPATSSMPSSRATVRAQVMQAAVEGLRPRGDLVLGAEHAPLLREDDELGSSARRPRARGGPRSRGCDPCHRSR